MKLSNGVELSTKDRMAGKNILSRGLSTVEHTGTYGLDPCNAWGEDTATMAGTLLFQQVAS